jgi:hypothetical protein
VEHLIASSTKLRVDDMSFVSRTILLLECTTAGVFCHSFHRGMLQDMRETL